MRASGALPGLIAFGFLAGPLPAAAQAAKPSPPAKRAAPPATSPAPSIEGVVRGPDRKPLEKALLIAFAVDPRPGESPVSARTDAQGRFKLTVRRAAKHSVRVESSGLAGRTLRDVVPGAPLTIDLALGGTIEGVVRDAETGQLAAGIRVGTDGLRLTSEPEAGRVETTTDAEGRFKLAGLEPGRHDLAARARGRGYASRKAVPVGARVELLLEPSATLFGTITGPEGKPVPGAIVTPLAVRSAQAPRPERSDERGRYEVTGLDAGLYDVAVRAPGLAPAALSDVVLEARGEVQADVALQPGARVTGRLVDANDTPLAGRVAIGELQGQPAPYLLGDLLRAEAGADGRFVLEAVPPGAHAMAADAKGQGQKRVDLEVSATQRVLDLGDVRMESGLVLRGRVRDAAGQPIADASVQAQAIRSRTGIPSTGRTDADGTFAIGGLEAVSYRVVASARGFGRATETFDPGPQPVELVLAAAGTISGKVVDDRGRPVESFKVLARPIGDQGPTALDQFEAADGRFVLENVDAGSYAVTVEAADRAAGSASAKVAAGGAADVGTLTLGVGRTLRGTVVDSSGAFVAGARVTLRYPRPSGSVTTTFGSEPEIVTDRAGAFETKGVKDGPLEVTASHPGYARSLPVSLVVDAAPAPDVRLVLTQGSRIEGTFRRRDGAPVAGSFVVATPLREETWTGGPLVPVQPDGSFVIEHVPAGRVRVTTMTAAGRGYRSAQARELDVREGETATLDIVNREILLNGRVTRSAGSAGGLRLEAHGSGMVTFGGRGAPVAPAPGGPERMAAVTREDGTFEMIVDEPGSVRMTVWSADLRFRFPVRVIQVPDADSFAAELAFEGAPVNGVVVDRDTEAPLPYAMVSAGSREPGRNGATATTGPDGRFQLELEPGDYRFGAFPKDGGYARVLVDVSVSPAGAADVRIPLPRGLRITGRATDPAGRPIADVRVSAFSFADSSSQTETMADGRFEMRGLKNVEHLVTAWSDAGLFAIRTGVGAGTTELPLPMQRAARVVVQLVTADGRPVAGVEPQVGNIDGAPNMTGLGTCVARSDAQGRAQMLTPAGRVLIRAQRGTLEGYAPVDVEAGGTTTVRVTLEDASHRQVTAR